MTVLDLSNYDADTFDPACMKAAGVEGIILGCQRIGIAYSMAQKARDAELPILGTYAYLYFAAAPSATHDAIIVAKAYGVPRVWLDVEDTSGNLPPLADRIREVANCVQAVEDAGLQAGIYTGGWYWPDKMGNTTEFSRLPLWHSAYLNGEGTPYEVRTVNYGGWTDIAVHQWTSTLDVCGRKRDANHYYLEEEMTPEQVAEIAAGQFLELLAQAVGAKDSTFSDTEMVDLIRARLTQPQAPSGGIAPGTKFTAEVI